MIYLGVNMRGNRYGGGTIFFIFLLDSTSHRDLSHDILSPTHVRISFMYLLLLPPGSKRRNIDIRDINISHYSVDCCHWYDDEDDDDD